MAERACPVCGRRFFARTGSHTYCTPVCRARTQHRPGGKARYGHEYRKDRRAWAVEVKRGIVPCAGCDELIRPDEAWHLDHLDNGLLRPSHAGCNVAAGGRKSYELAFEDNPAAGVYWGPGSEPDDSPRRWSRPWAEWRDDPRYAGGSARTFPRTRASFFR
jgi:hypothetical protein